MVETGSQSVNLYHLIPQINYNKTESSFKPLQQSSFLTGSLKLYRHFDFTILSSGSSLRVPQKSDCEYMCVPEWWRKKELQRSIWLCLEKAFFVWNGQTERCNPENKAKSSEANQQEMWVSTNKVQHWGKQYVRFIMTDIFLLELFLPSMHFQS